MYVRCFSLADNFSGFEKLQQLVSQSFSSLSGIGGC